MGKERFVASGGLWGGVIFAMDRRVIMNRTVMREGNVS